MHWSAVPFGKYKGKTFPEIIVQDPDWFFWVLPKLYGKLAEEAKSWRRKHEPSKSRNQIEASWKSNMNLTGSTVLWLCVRQRRQCSAFPMDRLDFHTSICGGLFAANMTSERAVS